LALPTGLRDGTKLFGFTRFCFPIESVQNPATRDSLRSALNSKVLDNLIKRKGYMILYTHLGRQKVLDNVFFSEEDQLALLGLAERFYDGLIWVAPTSQILQYWLVSHYLEWKCYKEGEKIIINLVRLNDPVSGPNSLNKRDLNGICFYTERPKDTIICLKGKPLKTVIHSFDHTGKSCIGFPVAPIPGTDLLE
jgi:hypothetical protein